MAQIVWSRRSQGDLMRLYRFLAPNSPRAAQRAVHEIRKAVLKLAAFPEAGRPVAELGGDRRELLIPFGDSGYAMIYLFDGSIAEILSVKHMREAGH
jgi:plasmid stabilization system protein ParE